MRAIIAAVSPEWVIGLNFDIPWHYSADMKRFKRLTMGATLVMGRHTWNSLPRKPLPGRRNVVITGRNLAGVECFSTMEDALETCEADVWFIGGARIFEEAMDHADLIDLTLVPDQVNVPGVVRFPKIDETVWEAGPIVTHDADDRLKQQIYRRRLQ